jgi:hypothetical protein
MTAEKNGCVFRKEIFVDAVPAIRIYETPNLRTNSFIIVGLATHYFEQM